MENSNPTAQLFDSSLSSPPEEFNGFPSDNMIGDRYRLLKLLGQGNFGRTYLAADQSLPDKRLCAIKQFFPQSLGSTGGGEAAVLFRQEAERLRELGSHPQIPGLLDYVEQQIKDGEAPAQFIVQEFIDGVDLEKQLAAEGPFNEGQIRSLLKNILPVLQFVHEHHVIHRDIKPQNIIRQPQTGQLVLVDFGAAKYATGTALAKTGTMIGTAAYTAPEQVMGRAVFASDLYSLGVTCIHLLTGMNPFELMDHGQGGWVWQDYLTNKTSAQTTQLIDKLLERGTQHRYASAAAVLDDLELQNSQWSYQVTYLRSERWNIRLISPEGPEELTFISPNTYETFGEADRLAKEILLDERFDQLRFWGRLTRYQPPEAQKNSQTNRYLRQTHVAPRALNRRIQVIVSVVTAAAFGAAVFIAGRFVYEHFVPNSPGPAIALAQSVPPSEVPVSDVLFFGSPKFYVMYMFDDPFYTNAATLAVDLGRIVYLLSLGSCGISLLYKLRRQEDCNEMGISYVKILFFHLPSDFLLWALLPLAF